KFEPIQGRLEFDSPLSGGNFIYRIGNFTQPAVPRVFDVTDPFQPVELTGLLYEDQGGGLYRLSFETVESGRRRYRILGDAATMTNLPSTEIRDASSISLTNLRAASNSADYVIVYYDEFRDAAEQLKTWRETHLPIEGNPGPYQALALPVTAIYDQFTGGRMDPGAI